MNEKQIAHLKAFIRGEPVPSMYSGHFSSMYTAQCDVCGAYQLYPRFVGIGPEVQVIHKAAREEYAIVCEPCISELRKEHFRRTAYSKLFGESDLLEASKMALKAFVRDRESGDSGNYDEQPEELALKSAIAKATNENPR